MRVFCATFALAELGTVRMKIVLPATVILLVCLSKSAGAHTLAIVPLPRAGDCTLKFQAPPDTKPSDVRITLDSDTAPLAPAITAGSPMVAKLAQPLAVNSQVTVRVGTAFVTALVQAPPDGASATATVCSADAKEGGVRRSRGLRGVRVSRPGLRQFFAENRRRVCERCGRHQHQQPRYSGH